MCLRGQALLEDNAEPSAALNRIREVLLVTPEGQQEFLDGAAQSSDVDVDKPALDLLAQTP